MKSNFKICVCASGGGGNFQALIDNQERVGYSIVKLITDRDCMAIKRAQKNKINFKLLNRKLLKNKYFDLFEREIPFNVDLIVLAGFMPIIPESLCKKYDGKIINTHPSLLPNYGGKGMFGVHVQEAVLNNGEKYAGCTVHYVNSKIDGGKIILQSKIEVNNDETAWNLGGRVFLEENKILPEAIRLIMNERRK